MNKFVFVMQHDPTPEQLTAAATDGREVVQIGKESREALLNVADDPTLGRDWFVAQAEKVLAAVGGVGDGDIAHIMGQAQLAAATQAAARKAGAILVESCTKRDSVEKTLPDGKVVKTNVFIFKGFRTVHSYE